MSFQVEYHLVKIAHIFISKLDLRISYTSLKEEIFFHKDYPSLASLTDVLSFFKVNNLTVSIPIEKLKEVPSPALTQIKTTSQLEFVVLDSVTDKEVVYTLDSGKQKKLSFGDFEEIWNHVVLMAEPDEKSGESESDFMKNRKLESTKKVFSVVSFVFGLPMLIWFTLSIPLLQSTQLFLKLLGLGVAALLVIKQLGKGSTLLNSLCEGRVKMSCDSILDHPSSRLFDIISLTDLTVIYYTSTFFLLLINQLNSSMGLIEIYQVFTIISALMTVYTLLNQWLVIKRWCPLCLVLTVVIWSEVLLLIITTSSFEYRSLAVSGLTITLFVFLSVGALWFWLHSLLQTSKEEPLLKRTVNKFKRNPLFFRNAMRNGDSIEKVAFEHEIITGNHNVENTILLISRPDCPLCFRAHEMIDRLTDSHFRIIHRFLVNLEDPKSTSYQFLQTLITLKVQESQESAIGAMHAWFRRGSVRNITAWRKEFHSATTTHKKVEQTMRMHHVWCDRNKITATPTIILNGIKIPEEFTLSDIYFHLNHLED